MSRCCYSTGLAVALSFLALRLVCCARSSNSIVDVGVELVQHVSALALLHVRCVSSSICRLQQLVASLAVVLTIKPALEHLNHRTVPYRPLSSSTACCVSVAALSLYGYVQSSRHMLLVTYAVAIRLSSGELERRCRTAAYRPLPAELSTVVLQLLHVSMP